MTRLASLVALWPTPVSLVLAALLFVSTAAEEVEIPTWLLGAFNLQIPEEPAPDLPAPPKIAKHVVPYAPAPGRDERAPIDYISHVFELEDPDLPNKMSGVGVVFWDHSTRATGTMIAPDVVLTTAHLFVERGQWKGLLERTDKPPRPDAGRIYLEACGRAYDFAALEVPTLAPRDNLGEDYLIAILKEPVCAEASTLQVARAPDDITEGGEDQIFMDLGYHTYPEVPRYSAHPLFTTREPRDDGMHSFGMFGAVCTPVANRPTKPVADGSTGLIITKGCWGRPGSSGGGVFLSRDGGASYALVGVSNSYSKVDPEFNSFTRVEGAMAKHIARHVDLVDLPAAQGSTSPIATQRDYGPWLPTLRPTAEVRP